MIVYELACAHGHRFEGWFASSDAFTEQQARSLVTCPMCNDAAIRRVPSARVSVPKGAASAAAPRPPVPTPPTPTSTANDIATGLPAEVVTKLRDMVKQTENVGRRFPEEARKIHYEEAPARAIRGQASSDEAEALREEGIDFASVPPFLLPDQH
jgi:hypothetical protein